MKTEKQLFTNSKFPTFVGRGISAPRRKENEIFPKQIESTTA